MNSYQPISAADLYAISQRRENTGEERCHWCNSKCPRLIQHDDRPLMVGIRNTSTAKNFSSGYICIGCWLWRRTRISVEHLMKKENGLPWLRDGHCPVNHSWWIINEGAWILQKSDYPDLYDKLLKPPLRFTLSLLSAPKLLPIDPIPKPGNLLHLAKCNDTVKIDANTTLWYTIDNIAHCYTVYELEQLLLHGKQGKEAGVQTLVNFLGKPKSLPNGLKELPQASNNIKTSATKFGGRPPNPPLASTTVGRTLAASGRQI